MKHTYEVDTVLHTRDLEDSVQHGQHRHSSHCCAAADASAETLSTHARSLCRSAASPSLIDSDHRIHAGT